MIKIYKIVLALLVLGTFLNADSVQVLNLAEKLTLKVQVNGGHGTGFIINKEGYVITNNHVTSGARDRDIVLLNQHKEYRDITLVKTYPKKDITILRINNYSDGEYLRLQAPSTIKKGHESFSLGYPGGSELVGDKKAKLDSTIKGGDVSKVFLTSGSDGKFAEGYKLIETSSDINGGNSGGPLLSRLGTVIGINTFGNNDAYTLQRTGSIVQGIFWAIHVEELINVLDENNIDYTLSTDDIGEIDISMEAIIYMVLALLVVLAIFVFLLKKQTPTDTMLSRLVNKKIGEKQGPTPSGQKTVLDPIKPGLSPIEIGNRMLTVGRSRSCDVVLVSAQASGRHLTLESRNGVVYVTDLNSTNGTYIGGSKLSPNHAQPLHANQKLIIGSEEVIYMVR